MELMAYKLTGSEVRHLSLTFWLGERRQQGGERREKPAKRKIK